MGGGGQQAPAPAPAPPAPNYAAANREAVQADIDTLGTRRRIEQASKLGRSVYDPDTGKTYDFSGLGDSELGKEQARVDAETADMQAQAMLDQSRKYGSQFIDEARKGLEQSDPYRFRSGEKLGAAMEKELDNLDDIDPELLREAEADIRGAQYARGNTRGPAPIAQEVLGKFDVRNRVRQQKLGNISQYLAGTPISAQFSSLSGAQAGASPYAPVNYQAGMGLNPNAGAMGTQFALGSYGQQLGAWQAGNNYQMNAWQANANRPNPWMQAGGMAVGVGTALGGAAILA
jgi:hypothetical protein